jgi:hypothetical protein
MTRVLFLLFTILFVAQSATGQDFEPDATRQTAWDAFKVQEGDT